MTARGRAVGLALVLAILSAIAAPAVGLAPVPVARAASAADLVITGSAVYTPDPATRRIHVAVALTATNTAVESRTRRFYFEQGYLAVQPGATAFKVSGVKGATVKVVSSARDSTLLRLGFGTRLASGKSLVLHLTFDILTTGRNANPQARAARGLITIPVWAFGSARGRGSVVQVVFPAGWQVTVESGEFATHELADDGGTVLGSGSIAAPLTWFAYVSAQQPAVYASRPVTIAAAGQEIELVLREWVDDRAWGTRTETLLGEALPALRTQIGIPWPATAPVTISESVSRVAGGYAGLYDPAASEIDIAYWAGPLVTVHEAAHGWFNGTLLADRWAVEGFASLYGVRVAAELKLKGKAPALTPELEAAAVPLNAWPQVRNGATGDATLEAYGFAASYALADAIAARAGDAALARVWADAADRIGAYQPPPAVGAAGASDGVTPTVESMAAAPDWRGLLDLLEAETGQDFTDLWRASVVRPEEAGLLDARAAARADYAQTLAVSGAWSLPRSIRDGLRAWRFDSVQALLADARTVLAQHEALESMADRAGLVLPDRMRALFEAGDLAAASAQAEAERNAILQIAGAAAARTTDADPLTRIGLWGADPEAELAAAHDAFTAGDMATVAAASDAAYHAWNDAWQEGRRRVLIALVVLVGVFLLAGLAASAFRRSRRRAGGVTLGPSIHGTAAAGTGPAPRSAVTAAADAEGDPFDPASRGPRFGGLGPRVLPPARPGSQRAPGTPMAVRYTRPNDPPSRSGRGTHDEGSDPS